MSRTSKRKSQRGASSSAQPVSYRETSAMIEMQEALERARKKSRANAAAAAAACEDAGDLQAHAASSVPAGELSRREAFKQRWVQRMADEGSEGAAAAAAAPSESAFRFEFAVVGFKHVMEYNPETLIGPFFDKNFNTLAAEAGDPDLLNSLMHFKYLWVAGELAICRKCYEPCTRKHSDESGLFICSGCTLLTDVERQVAEAVVPLQQRLEALQRQVAEAVFSSPRAEAAGEAQARARWREEELEASRQDKIELAQFRHQIEESRRLNELNMAKLAESSRLHDLNMETMRQLRQLVEQSQLQGPSQAPEPEPEPEPEPQPQPQPQPQPSSDIPVPMDEGEDASSISSQEVRPFVPPVIGLASNEPPMSQQSAASAASSTAPAAAAADGSYRCVKCKCRIPLTVSSLFNAKRRKAKVCLLCPIPK
jgi:hypothetical protein